VEKPPTGHRLEGCDQNGPAAVRPWPDRLRIDSDMRPPCALRGPILMAAKAMLIKGQDTTALTDPVGF